MNVQSSSAATEAQKPPASNQPVVFVRVLYGATASRASGSSAHFEQMELGARSRFYRSILEEGPNSKPIQKAINKDDLDQFASILSNGELITSNEGAAARLKAPDGLVQSQDSILQFILTPGLQTYLLTDGEGRPLAMMMRDTSPARNPDVLIIDNQIAAHYGYSETNIRSEFAFVSRFANI